MIEFINKISRYLKAFVMVVKERARIEAIQNNPSLMVKSLQKLGVKIDDDVILFSPETLNIDMTRPSLINVGGGDIYS